jgi:hypothetical protein
MNQYRLLPFPGKARIRERLFVAVLSTLLISGCLEGEKSKMNFFHSENSRKLSDRMELAGNEVVIDISPPVEIRRSVQYVTLSVSSANLWRTGGGAGVLLMPDGKPIRLSVDLESVAGKRFELRSVSFGKDLMFSYLNEDPGATSDLPKGELFSRVRVKSSQALIVDEIRWIDITNK